MNTPRAAVSLLLALLLLSAADSPAASLRCGTRLITEGDPREKLLQECGPPSDATSWQEERWEEFDHPPSPRLYREFERRRGGGYGVRRTVLVELWTYNWGPSRFIDIVRIENGFVRRIESGGYGY